jgi:hypothetical protein
MTSLRCTHCHLSSAIQVYALQRNWIVPAMSKCIWLLALIIIASPVVEPVVGGRVQLESELG